MQSSAWSSRGLWLLLIASLGFNAGVGATAGLRAYNRYAEADPGVEKDRPGRGGGRLMRQLDLTPEQQELLRAARVEMRQRHQGLRSEIREQTEALVTMLGAEQPDREAIAAQVGAIAERREQLDHDMVDHLLDVRGMLQPAQHEAFDEIIRRILQRGGHGDHGPRGFGGRHEGPGQRRRGHRHADPEGPE